MSRARALVLNGALVAVSLLVAAGAAELALRLLGLDAPVRYHLNPSHAKLRDVQTSWDVTYETNALGLRWDEIAARKPAGVVRLALVGDSYTFGMGCERRDTFPDRLQAMLRTSGRPVEVMNISNFSIGPIAYADLVTDLALPLGADIVVVTVCGNDASQTGEPPADRRVVRALASRSHLVTLLRIVRRTLGARGGSAVAEIPVGEHAVLPNDPDGRRARALADFRRAHGSRYNNLVAGLAMDPDEVARWLTTPEDGTGWREFRKAIAAIDDACKRRGVKLVLGIVPDGAAVDPRQGEIRRTFGVAVPDDVLTAPFKFEALVTAFAASRGIPCFDPTEKFRTVRDGLYFDADIHWTPEGNALYAAELARFLDASLPAAP